eukprot:Clim_evm17s22 gene=Clim_evmTU17s22
MESQTETTNNGSNGKAVANNPYDKKTWKAWSVWKVLLMINFLLSGTVVSAMQAATLVIFPINHKLYSTINSKIVYLMWAQIIFLADWWANINVTFYGREEDFQLVSREGSIVVPNHCSDVDWLVGWIVGERRGMLTTTKALIKKQALYLPLVGWSMWFLEWGFLDRNWDKDKETMDRTFRILKEYPLPYFMTVFAEGTRQTPSKLKESQEFMKSKGYPVLKNVMWPKTKGFVTTVQHLRDNVGCITDVVFGFPEGKAPNLGKMMNGQGGEVHVYMNMTPMKDIPKDDEGVKKWVENLYIEKDKKLEYFKKHEKFDHIVATNMKRSVWPLIVTVGWAGFWTVSLGPSIFHWFVSGNVWAIGLIGGGFAAATGLIMAFENFTSAAKGTKSISKKKTN